MELHNNIRDYRRKAGLTQEQLAEAMGITGASVSKWENGQSAPDLAMLLELADYFGISVDALLGHRVRAERLTELTNLVKELGNQGQLEEACALAEQILRNYPNDYGAVDHMTHHYYLMFMQTREKTYMERAIELTKRLFTLLDGPEDKRRIGLYTSLANQYELLGELDKAVEYYEKGNVDQSNDRNIAHCYVRMGKLDQALPLVSDRLLSHLFQLFQYVSDLSEIWQGKGEMHKARAAVEWGSRVMESTVEATGMVPVSLNALLLLQLAVMHNTMGNRPEAEAAVRKMIHQFKTGRGDGVKHPFLEPAMPLNLVGNMPQSPEQLIAILEGAGWDHLVAAAKEEMNR